MLLCTTAANMGVGERQIVYRSRNIYNRDSACATERTKFPYLRSYHIFAIE